MRSLRNYAGNDASTRRRPPSPLRSQRPTDARALVEATGCRRRGRPPRAAVKEDHHSGQDRISAQRRARLPALAPSRPRAVQDDRVRSKATRQEIFAGAIRPPDRTTNVTERQRRFSIGTLGMITGSIGAREVPPDTSGTMNGDGRASDASNGRAERMGLPTCGALRHVACPPHLGTSAARGNTCYVERRCATHPPAAQNGLYASE